MLDFGSTKLLKVIQENIPNICWEIICDNSKFRKIEICETLQKKTRAEQPLRSVLSNLENLEHGINIFERTWNGNLGNLQFTYRNPNVVPWLGIWPWVLIVFDSSFIARCGHWCLMSWHLCPSLILPENLIVSFIAARHFSRMMIPLQRDSGDPPA